MERTTDENRILQGPRQFFWDILLTLDVLVIFSLAIADLVIEFLRGADIACFAVNSTTSATEISHFCAAHVPSGVYFSYFVVFHGFILISAHYLWHFHCKGCCTLFFKVVSSLHRKKDENGRYSSTNTDVVKEMEEIFSGRRIFHSYIIKIFVQLFWIIAGFCFSLAYFHQEFGPLFNCTDTLDPIFEIDFNVICTVGYFNLLETLWIAELVLLSLAGLLLLWAIMWCFTAHHEELGAVNNAKFLYHYGLSSKFYAPNAHLAYSCNSFLRNLFCTATLFKNCKCNESHIATSLDFLLMTLYHTDCGLGYTFKKSQILYHYYKMHADERRRLHIHTKKHQNILADESEGLC